MEKQVLIVSTSHDEESISPVRQKLTSRGYEVVTYQTDKVLNGLSHFSLDLSTDGYIDIQYKEKSIAPNDIVAAWYRKPAAFGLDHQTNDRAKQQYIQSEIRAHHDSIWSLYPDRLWLNSPDSMRIAERKIGQLILAQELGFTIPRTMLSNDWSTIENALLVDDKSQMIVKMIRGVISEGNDLKALFTTVLDKSKLESIRDLTIPFPGIYQGFIDKAREWRVTVVGEEVFPAAIYTSDIAKDDWRKLQTTNEVVFKNDLLPEDVGEKCVSFLDKLGLGFGAFDFVETQDGEMVFLECNPNGQYGWLEDSLDLKISDALVSRLIHIANERT